MDRNGRGKTLAGLLVLGLLATGCGNEKSESSRPAASTQIPTSSTASPLDLGDLPAAKAVTAEPCDLLTIGEIADATGADVSPGVASTAACEWKTDAKYSIAVTVQSDPDAAFGPRQQLASALSESGAEVVGVANQAIFLDKFQAIYLREGAKYAAVAINGPKQVDPKLILSPLAEHIAERI